MASYNFVRLKRLTIIYNVVQVGLFGLLLFMAYNFMLAFTKYGIQGGFIKSFGLAVGIQLVLAYPAWWLSRQDVEVEIGTSLVGVTPEQLVALRRKRMIGDIWKISALGAFVVFVSMSPSVEKGRGASLILAISYFAFLLTSLTYFQCFNFNAKRRRKELS
jgi:hypothetical protein